MNIHVYTPRRSTHEGYSRSKGGDSGYKGYNGNERGNLITTLRENCNNKEELNKSQNRIPTKILKQSINLVESIRKLTNQNDKTPRFYVHRTNKKYYEKYNIKTPTDFSIYILNLCEEYLKKIDTTNTDFIKNKLPSTEKIQIQLYYYKTSIEKFNAINNHTKDLLNTVSLQINNLIAIGKQPILS